MSSSVTSLPLDKATKYDRQLRLWGDHGQAHLEVAKVCLVNATATGTEILKNLILPGVGAFTIVDGYKVKGEDVGNNFFLDKTSIGKSRAQVAAELLLELNPDVRGDYIDESPEQILDNSTSYFNNFSIVIATNLPEKTLMRLAATLWDAEVPLLLCITYGFIGYMRLVIKEHVIVESHPDNAFDDLRLDRPFPSLVDFVNSQNLGTMSKKDHSHTPYLVILMKYIDKWKANFSSTWPKSYSEKNELKRLIREGVIENEDGYKEEENFEEALRAVNTALIPTKIPDMIKKIFKDQACMQLTSESKPFWIMARAVRDFVEVNEFLPLRGSIPDMTADSERYIQLQNLYRDQANKDIDAIMVRVYQLLQSLGKPSKYVTEQDIKVFCRNAAFLNVIRCRSIEQEYNPEKAKTSEIASHLDDPDSEMIWYVLLRSVQRFYTEFNRYPGYYDEEVEADIVTLKSCTCKILQEWGLGPVIKDDFIHEICRSGASELHTVAAFIGGAGAQEAIKIITKQFVPFNNTFIYNAMTQTSATFEL